jgi:carboxyl-terminal processing protease
MNRTRLPASLLSFLILTTAISLFSCRKESDESETAFQPLDSIEAINRWVLDSMRHYYYWSESMKIPSDLSGNTQNFFRGLLMQQDAFSWISDGAQLNPPQSCFTQYGFHYLFVQHAPYSSSRLLGVIALVAPGSPADFASIARGDYFSKVNGIDIQPGNISELNAMLQSGKKITLSMVNASGGGWVAAGTKSLSPQVFEERPIYNKQVFEKNGKKAGYLFYNSFVEQFDADILNAISELKSRQVSELILDLRYNSGGSTSSAAKLMALCAPVNSNDVFAIFRGNNTLGDYTPSFDRMIQTSSSVAGKNFADLIARRLPLSRVFVLTTKATASAAELLINNLLPYVQVVQIGESTVGKEMAGAIIRDRRQPRQVNWYMQPLIYKIYNARNSGNYSNGITPQHQVSEYAQLPLFDNGSRFDPLIKKTLELIYGTNDVATIMLAREKYEKQKSLGKVMFNSVIQLRTPDVIIDISR